MKNFIFKLILFSIPVVLFLSGLDFFISKNLYRTGRIFGDVPELHNVKQGSINSDILIAGSSRAEVHVNSQMVEDAFSNQTYNIGTSGSHWTLIKDMCEQYLEKNTKPKHLLINFDHNTLVKEQKLAYRNSNLPYTFLNFKHKKLYDLDYFSILIPGVRYAGEKYIIGLTTKQTLLNKITPSDKHKGFLSVNKEWATTGIPKDFNDKKELIPIDSMINYLLDLKEQGINIILFTSPYYYELISEIENYDKTMLYYSKIFKNNNLPYLDYSNDSINQDKTMFYNFGHLNTKGADVFTNKLIKDLKDKKLLN